MEESNIEGVFIEPEIKVEEYNLDKEIQETLFYSQKYYLSPSSLGKYLWRPQAWYKWYVLKQREDRKETKALIEGSLIHMFILEPHEFEKRYCISKEGLVKDKQKEVIDSVFAWNKGGTGMSSKLSKYSARVLFEMELMNYFQNLKEDTARLAKVITSQAEEYWEFLKKKEGKTLISQEQYDYCKKAADIVAGKYHEELGLLEQVEKCNECEVQCELENYEFGLKGILDSLVIRHDRKLIILNDVKTTVKTLHEFAKDSVEFYGIDLQIATYVVIIMHEYKELIEKGYTLQVNIIVVNQFGDSYCFPVSESTLEKWCLKLKNKMDDFQWSWNKRDFSNHRCFIENTYIL